MQRLLLVIYLRLGTTYRPHLQGSSSPSPLEDETDKLCQNIGTPYVTINQRFVHISEEGSQDWQCFVCCHVR